jgi:hypothetical protein
MVLRCVNKVVAAAVVGLTVVWGQSLEMFTLSHFNNKVQSKVNISYSGEVHHYGCEIYVRNSVISQNEDFNPAPFLVTRKGRNTLARTVQDTEALKLNTLITGR